MKTLREIEQEYIIQTMWYFKGNKIQAAKSLGISLKTLYNKLKKYGAIPAKMEGQ